MPILGAWVTQLVKRPTLGFGSGHGLKVHGFGPLTLLCTDSAEPACDSLSAPRPPPVSLSQNK